MDPLLLQSSNKLLRRHDILAVVIWRENEVYYQNIAPCFTTDLIQALGVEIHELFCGYASTNRSIAEISMIFAERFMHIHVLKDGQTFIYLAAVAETLEGLTLAVDEITGWNVEAIFNKSERLPNVGSLRSAGGQSWNHFLVRLKSRLENSLAAEEATAILTHSLTEFNASPTAPLPNEQWLPFAHHIANQIEDPEALTRFNQLHLTENEAQN
jgi:hypothetical protein